MWLKWLPWRWVVSRLARSRGFIDPMALWSRLHRFSQPSEVAEPVELLRAGVIFHARGLINSRAIQHNLDWVWPWWVERQFDPRDTASFVPRAFSITHVNLTHRNWTAIGVPEWDWLPIVDPRGLLTPLLDGWSIDAWIITDDGVELLASRHGRAKQELLLHPTPRVRTQIADEAELARLDQLAEVVRCAESPPSQTGDGEADSPDCRLRVEGRASRPGWLILSIRPANPEGVSFVHELRYRPADRTLRVNAEDTVHLNEPPDRVAMSHYKAGDVHRHLPDAPPADHVRCHVGLATAALMYRLEADQPRQVELHVPMRESHNVDGTRTRALPRPTSPAAGDWDKALAGTCQLDIPDAWMQFLYDAALRSLILHAPGEVYPGPYTYRRFWFRDAAYILEGMLAANMPDRVGRAIGRFPERQTGLGYFRSQEGEWDSNGQAIWIIDRYRRLSGRPLPDALMRAVLRGARWITQKRTSDALDAPHAGLMPAGFSAEHLGPNDYYYWDDFWSIAGLRHAAILSRDHNHHEQADRFERDAERLLEAIDRSLERSAGIRGRTKAIPAAPYRRMDSGAVGSLAGAYPLAIWSADDERMAATIDYLHDRCLVEGGFFQDMIHSGINAYLTLHMAQVMLRAGDDRYWPLVRRVAELASPTGQWPEAIHPHTRGGCMGDGQHIWAACEWVLMMRSLFVREEDEALILGQGLPEQWLGDGKRLRFGPTLTPHGPVTVHVEGGAERVRVSWTAQWRGAAPEIHVQLRGCQAVRPEDGADEVVVERLSAGADVEGEGVYEKG